MNDSIDGFCNTKVLVYDGGVAEGVVVFDDIVFVNIVSGVRGVDVVVGDVDVDDDTEVVVIVGATSDLEIRDNDMGGEGNESDNDNESGVVLISTDICIRRYKQFTSE
jgi:hypothetical protein